MALGDPLNEALTFLRNTIAASPEFGDKWRVLNIETFGDSPLIVLDLDDGTSIGLTVDRAERDVFDEESLQAKLKRA
jgi:hypothetical protein